MTIIIIIMIIKMIIVMIITMITIMSIIIITIILNYNQQTGRSFGVANMNYNISRVRYREHLSIH